MRVYFTTLYFKVARNNKRNDLKTSIHFLNRGLNSIRFLNCVKDPLRSPLSFLSAQAKTCALAKGSDIKIFYSIKSSQGQQSA